MASTTSTNIGTKIKSYADIVGYIVVLGAFCSVIVSNITKLRMIGRALYFHFDINNISLQTQTIDTIIQISLIGAIVFATLLFIPFIIISRLATKKVWRRIIYFGWFVIASILAILIVRAFVPGQEWQILFYCESIGTLLFFFISYFVIIKQHIDQTLKGTVAGYIISLFMYAFLVAVLMLLLGYQDAQNQRDFKMISITENNQKKDYIIINEGDNYSAYECDLPHDDSSDEAAVNVKTSIHRYFPKDSLTVLLHFDKVYFNKNSVTLQQYQQN